MSDETGFLRAIQAAPADATPKLVYADWLDEHGEHEKAEYLRIRSRARPDQPLSEADSRRLWELEVRHSAWADLLRGVPPLLDPATMYLLGRLQGLLAAHESLSNHEADISFDFEAALYARNGSLHDMVAAWVGQDFSPVTLEPLPNWEEDLRAVLNEWLFMELRQLRNGLHFRLAFLTEEGRQRLVTDVIGAIRQIITPTAGWRVHISEGRHFYALGWADVVLASADWVLRLHFSYSD